MILVVLLKVIQKELLVLSKGLKELFVSIAIVRYLVLKVSGLKVVIIVMVFVTSNMFLEIG